MTAQHHFARSLRLARMRKASGGMFLVPLDHPISDGPLTRPGMPIGELVRQLSAAGVDGIVVHKGVLRHLEPAHLRDVALVVHLSASTRHAPDPDAKCLVTGVEQALRHGADAVSVHVNVGSAGESQQLADLGRIADECDRWNVPLLAMMYPRGPQIRDPRDGELVKHVVAVASELGADLIKVPMPNTMAELQEVAASTEVPVLVAGGAARASEVEVLDFVATAIRGGASGVAMGRNVFQADDPYRMASSVSALLRQETQSWAQTGGRNSAQPQVVLA